MTPQVFYQCRRCGNCCRWPGFVRLQNGDIERIAARFSLSPEDAAARFTDLHPDRSALVLKNHVDGSCIFLEGINTCRIQHIKPLQCRGFPNAWNFPGWQEVCEAVPVPAPVPSEAA